MKIADMKVTELINAVGSDAPAPGGGAVAGLAGGIGVGIGDDHLGKARLEVGEVGGQAQHGHDLAGDGDLKAVLARHAAGLAAETVDDVAELTVIHIDNTLPGNALRIDAECIALMNMIV